MKNIINKCYKSMVVLAMLLLANFSSAQIKAGDLIDGISAVIGDEIILESDIREQENFAKQQGMKVGNNCEFVESMMNNKMLIYYAKKDTLIPSRSKEIRDQVDKKFQRISGGFPSEKEMLEVYKFRTIYEMKNAIEKIDTDQYYTQAKYGSITNKVDVTPNEVADFFEQNKYQLPSIGDEIALSHLVMTPKLTPEHKQQLINKLMELKKRIVAGESFEAMARLYSEDPGSASQGGVMKNISKGSMVKPFEAGALNLQEGEMSGAIESEFGFHLIKLIKKSGKFYEAAHILLKAEANDAEKAETKKQLNAIRKQILDKKITFSEACLRYSDDKATKFNAGNMADQETGSLKMDRFKLPTATTYQIAGLKKDDITDAFEDEYNRGKAIKILKIDDEISTHVMDIKTDYEKIKEYCINKKKSELVEKWVDQKIPETFINIDKRYKDCQFKINWGKVIK